jgi:hypothetical protein
MARSNGASTEAETNRRSPYTKDICGTAAAHIEIPLFEGSGFWGIHESVNSGGTSEYPAAP